MLKISKMVSIISHSMHNQTRFMTILIQKKPQYFATQKIKQIESIRNKIENHIERFVEPYSIYIDQICGYIVEIQGNLGVSWWAMMIICAIAMRASIFPLRYIRRSLISEFPILPSLKILGFYLIKAPFIFSQSLFSRIKDAFKDIKYLYQKQKSSEPLLLLHKLIFYPLTGISLYSLSKVIKLVQIQNQGFLYLNNLCSYDPYFILPTLVGLINLYNLRKLAGKQKNNIVNKGRSICKYLMVIWYPILSILPAGLNIFLLSSALFSIIENRLTKQRSVSAQMDRFKNKIIMKIAFWMIILVIISMGILWIQQKLPNYYLPSDKKEER